MEETSLDKLLAGRKLWNIWAPAPVHQEHLDDDQADLVDTGVLLGALNLIEGLLERFAAQP